MNKEKTLNSFDDLVIALQNAFIKVNNLAYEQHLSLINEYFDKNGNPYYITIKYHTKILIMLLLKIVIYLLIT